MKKSVLLADHDESVRKMVSRVLESAGYSVTQASSLAEANTGLRAARPDVVVWDLEMPAPVGTPPLEFCNPAEQPIPVVGITAWPDQEEKAVRKGLSALLEKPLDLRVLLQTIQDLLAAQDRCRSNQFATAS